MSALVPPFEAAQIVVLLEEAATALLALPMGGYTTALRNSMPEWSAVLSAAASDLKLRPPPPSATTISRMDQILGWLSLIPDDRYVLRRIVGARALVDAPTGRHLYSWRRLGRILGADHRSVPRWHAEGIGWITKALNQ